MLNLPFRTFIFDIIQKKEKENQINVVLSE